MIERVAFYLNRNDEQPNIDLAKTIAETADTKGVKEIVAGLRHENELVANDCIKVLYETGYLKPGLIAPYVLSFIQLLKSRKNRLVWGGMIALATIAALKPHDIFANLDVILAAYEKGSVITIDNSISVFAEIAKADKKYEKALFPVIEKHLLNCRPKEVPQHAERAFSCVNKGNAGRFLAILETRLPDLSPSQKKRIDKLIDRLKKMVG
jgi:hypothetical protein